MMMMTVLVVDGDAQCNSSHHNNQYLRHLTKNCVSDANVDALGSTYSDQLGHLSVITIMQMTIMTIVTIMMIRAMKVMRVMRVMMRR